LYQESLATGDAIGYVRDKQLTVVEKEAYRVLYPAYGTYIGGESSRFYTGYSYVFTIAAVIPGHIIGRIKASKVKNPPENAPAVKGSETTEDVSKPRPAETE
jgi:hypothetical protein